MKKATGRIVSEYQVMCPHCGYDHDSTSDWAWFNENIDNGVNERSEYEVKCLYCKEEFLIDGFENG